MSTASRPHPCAHRHAFLTAFLPIVLFACAGSGARAEGPPTSGISADGTIDLDAIRADGYEGPLDLRGQTVALAPGTLAPTLLPALGADGGWRSGFHLPSFDNSIQAMAIFQGNLYVGGSFVYMGDVYASGLARWDGVTWTGIPMPGVATTVRDLVVHDGRLVAGGSFAFNAVNGAACYNVARYDGTYWTAMRNGFSGGVYALAVSPAGQLVAGGDFYHSGSTVVRNVSYWSGTQWLPFASGGVNYAVYAIANYGGQIVIGGTFTADMLGNPLGGIARWTGTAWRGLSSDTATTGRDVKSLEVHEGSLYAGGTFTSIEGAPIQGLARWDGATWSAVSGFPGSINVTMLRSTPTALVASGAYVSGGASWDSIDDGIMTRLYDMILYGEDWLVSGRFPTMAASPYLAVLEGGALIPGPGCTNGAGLDARVSALTVHGGEVVASGDFKTAGSTVATGLAAWNGSEWREIGGGLTSAASALASCGGELVVGGSFLTVGGVTVNRIALWDGVQWLALGSGLNGAPYSMVQYGDDLVAAGGFSLAGGTAAANIARWDGSQWQALGSGLNNRVRTLVVRDGLLIVGGAFTTAGGVAAAHLAAWDGASWSQFGGGADGEVCALAELEGNLVAGGYFGQIGGVTASRVARLRAGQWESLGTGFNGQYCWTDPGGSYCNTLGVERLVAVGGELYASGTVIRAGAVVVNGLARWDDWNRWMAMDGGVTGTVYDMVTLDGALYVGGHFSTADGKPSANLAVWDEPTVPPVENFLVEFTVTPADGAVGLQWWTTGPGGEFRLTASNGEESWSVPISATSAGYAARDASACLAAGGSITYTLEHRDAAPAPWTVLAERSVELAGPPQRVTLLDPYPNPFNPRVRVSFVLARAQHARLVVYDLSGRRLATLADAAFAAGRQETVWLGLDATGARVPSGTYLLRIEGDFGSDVRKLSLVR